MVEPIAKKSVWIFITLFPVFISITQFSDFWVMSYGNWKHICNYTHMHGPTVSATHVSAAFDASSTAFFSTNIFIFLSAFFGLCCTALSFFFFVLLFFVFHFLWSILHCSFFLLLCFFVFCFSLSLVYAALFFLSSSFFIFIYFLFSTLHCSFFFLPFCLSHLRPIKKNQWLGQRIGCCGFVKFLGASSLEPKWLLLWALGVEGKKKGMLGLKSLVLGGNGVRGGKPTGMPDMLLRYGFHKK